MSSSESQKILSASAVMASGPLRIPESKITGAPAAASTTPGRQSSAGSPPLACRPPWVEQ